MEFKRIHRSVLLNECLTALKVGPGGVYADLTFGEGGHTEAMLKAGAKKVVAVDRDTHALIQYRSHGDFRDDPRLELHHLRFSEFSNVAEPSSFDGILIDLGVSTQQLLRPERGFSFSAPGPLDMRMDPQSEERNLLELLDSANVDALAKELERNTDMKPATPIARALVEAHRRGELQTTADLANLAKARGGKKHPATVIFLALRMWVNQELKEIEVGIAPLLKLLKPGGRLAVITFHSTEDRAVKLLFKGLNGKCVCSADQRICECAKQKQVELVYKKPVEPSREELRSNPRSRSAKLRCVELIGAMSQ